MRAKVLLGCCAFLVLAAVEANDALVAQGTFRTINVDVRVDCLAGRGVSFSLTPWVIEVGVGDSINWRLDAGANVTEMEVVTKQPGGAWPFRRKPPYRATKVRPAGAQALDNAQSGRRYKYAVSTVCVRDSASSDTVVIDPDIIIIRR